MSQALEKVAQLTPAEIMLLSALGGGSAFGGMRLLTDMSHKVAPPKREQNKIQLMMKDPNSHMPESATPSPGTGLPALAKSAMGNMDSYAPYLAAIAGAPVGFLGAKTIYDHYQENQGNKQIADAKKKYMEQLAAAQQMNKLSAETPLVDKFCEAVSIEFQKSASTGLPAAATTAAQNLGPSWKKMLGLGGALGGAGLTASYAPEIANAGFKYAPTLFGAENSNIPNVSPKEIAQVASHANPSELASAHSDVASRGTHAFNEAVNQATGGMTGGMEDLWVGGAGAVGLGTLAMLIHNHNKKKEREQKAQYPTGVEYAK
jgi:hypothetical protein